VTAGQFRARDCGQADPDAHRRAVDREPAPDPVVGLHLDADRADPVPGVGHPGGGADAALETVTDHPGARPDVALGHRTGSGVGDCGAHVLGAYVQAVAVVQQAVPGLRHDRQAPADLRRIALLDLQLDQCVTHNPDAVGVGQPDG